ncbi:MAG TPA: AcvB/VirJ family lysyl-phosphatidylglycerol hydrolase [Thermoanaerobaculia bacterium]|nr:AcvB/VirJ family lysyl-phosphatidylglycerol hydrolase [Thermoanaerobaculia bacterium]
MRRIGFLLLLLVAGIARASAPDERCPARTDITGLPVVTLDAKVPSDRFAVMITGDGGWRRIDRKITDRLRAAGIPIVGFIASDYYRTRRTPDESACDLERIIRYYRIQWKRNKVLLIGYSRGADVLPFMASRLPSDLRAVTQLIALLGLEPMIDFKYSPAWTLNAYTHKEPKHAVKPDVEKLRGQNVLCIFGAKEKDSLCHQLDPRAFKIVAEPGGHHFAGKYRDIADVILIESAGR